ncbi:MAG TPA: hypothetical protein PK633_14530 [Agitococcus sp.]|nr:hypothetical protein [Agitococcus sp.]
MKYLSGLSIILFLIVNHPAFADKASAEMIVSARVISSCNIDSNQQQTTWSCSAKPSVHADFTTIKTSVYSVSNQHQTLEKTELQTLIIYHVDF